jgi:hypothetical protein
MAKRKPNKPFKDWQAEQVEQTFGVQHLRSLPLLEEIKKIKLPENHELRQTLEKYRLEAFDFIESWNEVEYKFIFISPFFKLVDFTSAYYKVFTQRTLSVKYDNDTNKW